jgi:hypothetical protein
LKKIFMKELKKSGKRVRQSLTRGGRETCNAILKSLMTNIWIEIGNSSSLESGKK